MRSRNWRQHLHSQLSKAQKEAVMHKDGPMMVLAGPGSGKTLVITKRIQYLISHYQIPPQRILVITFTRAAANEMKERFWRLAGETLPVSFGTFHSVFFFICPVNFFKHFIPTASTVIIGKMDHLPFD